jgi:hypothetical protein
MLKDYTVKPMPDGWQENVIDVQNADYPKCHPHNAPAVCIIHDQPRCLACVEQDPTIRMWLKSGSLVSGGVM